MCYWGRRSQGHFRRFSEALQRVSGGVPGACQRSLTEVPEGFRGYEEVYGTFLREVQEASGEFQAVSGGSGEFQSVSGVSGTFSQFQGVTSDFS